MDSCGMPGNPRSASFQTAIRHSLLFIASAPPFSRTALPDFSASEATCGSTSGRDSKTTAMTPSGQDSLCKIRPSSSSVADSRFPSGSGKLATSRTRAAISPMPLSLIRNREYRACDIFPLDRSSSAATQSFALAVKMRSRLAWSASSNRQESFFARFVGEERKLS